MYTVRWIEDGTEKSKKFDSRDEAFTFQAGLLAKAKCAPDGHGGFLPGLHSNIKTLGVWR